MTPLGVVLTSLLGALAALALHGLGAWLGLGVLEESLGAPPLTRDGLAPEVVGSPALLALVVLPGQILLALLALVLARVSADGVRAALRLGAQRVRAGDLLLVPLAMPAAMILGSLLVAALHESPSSATMEEIRRLIDAPRSWPELLAVGAMLTLVPAVAEELFFRGWMQRRLELAVGPAAGIGIAAVAFALVHGDPVQSTGVLPAGLLLGYLTWRTRSLWPAILGHASLNGMAVVLARLAPEVGPQMELGPALTGLVSIVVASPLALGILVYQLERGARAAQGIDAA